MLSDPSLRSGRTDILLLSDPSLRSGRADILLLSDPSLRSGQTDISAHKLGGNPCPSYEHYPSSSFRRRPESMLPYKSISSVGYGSRPTPERRKICRGVDSGLRRNEGGDGIAVGPFAALRASGYLCAKVGWAPRAPVFGAGALDQFRPRFRRGLPMPPNVLAILRPWRRAAPAERGPKKPARMIRRLLQQPHPSVIAQRIRVKFRQYE